ncbi:prefoldin subunit [Cyclospora cayetanensis]|uniref:Prefoldin subunit n=1 Tax=Cyclospora cayetanensis TaxID=88456 RepID=A0A1D3D794_9EIME|nr:prefoldin subunit [Cyclospora cayetanensis]
MVSRIYAGFFDLSHAFDFAETREAFAFPPAQVIRLEDLVVPAKDGEHRSIPGAKFIVRDFLPRLLETPLWDLRVQLGFHIPIIFRALDAYWGGGDAFAIKRQPRCITVQRFVPSPFCAPLTRPFPMPGGLKEKVETFVGACNPMAVECLFKELLQKYRFMERSLLGQKDTLRAKTIAIKETMDAIKMLQTHRADVVVEYTLEEAEEVLSRSLKFATKYIEEAETDMEWLRTQITMTEVNIARVHNFAVLKRDQERAAACPGKKAQRNRKRVVSSSSTSNR